MAQKVLVSDNNGRYVIYETPGRLQPYTLVVDKEVVYFSSSLRVVKEKMIKEKEWRQDWRV